MAWGPSLARKGAASERARPPGRECASATVARQHDLEVATEGTLMDRCAASSPEGLVDIDDALARLPVSQRVVLVLRTREGLSEQEIATTLGIPAGTVKSRLHRARAAFREV